MKDIKYYPKAKVMAISRRNNSNSGNPNFEVTLGLYDKNGEEKGVKKVITKSDSSYNYDVLNMYNRIWNNVIFVSVEIGTHYGKDTINKIEEIS